ncbi:hybrid sensor histidine kinase/response regulator transcription factor [Desertivirga brevis]|uniref:hybrid sensor histidine kinase/response regulator transcription factor n=1 Tax=Desertivirga brevis TaxID=2810310 RepID=UPI001A973C01|nr:hybrid sensor histidine kinase/response regulator transcription factor [Pedobacter sp. SYSU D00873]
MYYISKGISIAFLLFVFVLFPKSSFCQSRDLKFEHISSQDGLAQNTIHGIIKDKYGFMWFGTWDGLCRYDGYSFKTYTYDPRDNKSINNNRIHNIVLDQDQNIWIRTFDNDELCRYNYEHDNFERIPRTKIPLAFEKLTERRRHVETVNIGFKGVKWHIDTRTNSLIETNVNTRQKTAYQQSVENPWSLSDSYVTDIYKDDHNIFWAGTYSNGINKANLNLKPFEHYYHNPLNTRSIIDNNVRAICEDKAGNLWIGTRDKGVTVMQGQQFRHIVKDGRKTINDNQIRSIFCDSRGLIWIGTKAGLNSYDPSTNTFRDYSVDGLKEISVFGITEDRDKNMWFATWNGVYVFDHLKNKLVHLDIAESLVDKFSRVIMQDSKGQVWIGAEGNGGLRGGITVLKQVNKAPGYIAVKHFFHNRQSNSLSDNRIFSIYEDRKGIVWIGTGNGLDRYDPSKNQFTNLSSTGRFPRSSIAAITEDEKGNLWISHKKGISKLNTKDFKVQNYTLQDGLQSNEFSDGAVYKSESLRKLFFGGNNGFNVFYPDSILPEKTLPAAVLTELQILHQRVGINEKVNGRVVLFKPLYLTRNIELNSGDKSIAIEFSGLHYSNPKGNKYAFKLEGFDKDWLQTDASRRIATYSNLEPGNYIFKVISSNSDGVWNTKPATLHIKVLPPFWASTWAYLLYGSLVVAGAFTYHYYATKFTRLQSKLAYEVLIREKENELHQNKLEFFTNISHEIKTPLTLILAPIERLLALLGENRIIRTQLTTMQASGDRLLKLVNELLDFRKLEAGSSQLELKKVDLVHFLTGVVSAFKPLANIKNVKLISSYKPGQFTCPVDEDKLEKIISNLLSNALRFTPVSGTIRISFELDQDKDGHPACAVIKVINNGICIPEEELELIFRPFRQASGNRQGGTGLGLAYSKSLVELHGGSIRAASSRLNKNYGETCFTVELPVNLGTGAEDTVEQNELLLDDIDLPNFPGISASIRTQLKITPDCPLVDGLLPTILLVEDNIELRSYLKEFFLPAYSVLEAENGVEGLKLAYQELPDLIVSDIMMMEMDGFEFCKRIKSDARLAHIPVVLLTAKSPLEDKIEGIELGADDYITKPFSLGLLGARVKSLLIARNQLKEKYRIAAALKPAINIPTSPDEKLLMKVKQLIEEHLQNSELSVEDVCNAAGMGRTQLYAKIKALTGLSIAELIKEMRLERSKQLLKDRKFNVSEVAFMVGFSEVYYFRKCFKAEFGITPSEYIKINTGRPA